MLLVKPLGSAVSSGQMFFIRIKMNVFFFYLVLIENLNFITKKRWPIIIKINDFYDQNFIDRHFQRQKLI
jgi:hypothetical protein